jgi:hypothetical protein
MKAELNYFVVDDDDAHLVTLMTTLLFGKK